MGAADDRVSELLDRWLASVELHARYLALDDAAYARVQDWPRHQRPTRWIVDLARSRLMELKRQLAERGARGDASFADALELMAFLTSLLGSEHVERFIPLAVADRARAEAAPAAPDSRPVVPAPSPPPSMPAQASLARPLQAPAPATPARSTPAPAAPEPVPEKKITPKPKAVAARNPARATAQPRPTRRAETPTPERKPAASPPAKAKAGGHDATTSTVIADAVRLLNWGRAWPQLASLIARLADRPAEPEVWTILRAHRAEIEAQASPPPE
jgi:hypothetical protein